MPYKCEKLHIPKDKDRRVKLNDEQKQAIQDMYPEFSQRELARKFKVSRRLITFILNPQKLKDNLEARKLRGGSAQYYSKDTQKAYMKTHRHYKHKLYKAGLLQE
jgi:hypothetical protein